MAELVDQQEQLPLSGAGQRLRAAREAAGLSRADIAARTRIAERHLASIEEERYADLASRAYAVGFSRAYARAVGLDEASIAQTVRDRLDQDEQVWDKPQSDTFEPGDPARVPPARVAWIGALGAIVVVAIVFVFWRSYYDPAISLPDLVRPEPAQVTAPAKRAPGSAPLRADVPSGDGAVAFTALESGLWVKFYDQAGNQLMQKQMAMGETYVVPAGAAGPMLWTARPDALEITVGGRKVPRLSDKPVTMKDVAVTAPALLARKPAPAPDPAVPVEASTVSR